MAASNILCNILSKKFLKQKLTTFEEIKTFYNIQKLSQEILVQEGLKSLLSSLLSSTSNESRFFNDINIFLSALTKFQHCEFLLVDKPHQVVYGYPALQELLPRESTQRMMTSPNKEAQENLVTFFDQSLSTEERFSQKIEVSFEKESLLRYIVNKKEIVCSWDLPHISLYNREIDVPLTLKDQYEIPSTYRHLKFENFIYYPICDKENEILGIVRIFLDSEETVNTETVDLLSK